MDQKSNVTEEERAAWRARDHELSRHAQIQVLIYEGTHRGHASIIPSSIASESESLEPGTEIRGGRHDDEDAS